MHYSVQIVGNEEMPENVDRAIVEREDGTAVLLISGVYADCWRWMRAWEDAHEPSTVPTILPPAPPLLSAV